MSVLVSQGAWGALVGATLGSPHRGKSTYTRLAFYDPIPLRMAPHESLDAWWVWLSHLRAKRSRGGLGHSLHTHWTSVTGESAFGLANLHLGFGPTLAGKLRNPLGTGSLALGRAVFWGLAFHNQPNEAAEWAFTDAALDHHGDGRDLAACLAWMTAAAHPGVSVQDLVGIFPQVLPVHSPFLQALPEILESQKKAEGTRELTLTLPAKLGAADSESAALTMAYVVSALLTSPSRFGPALLKAVGCGGASDQAGIAAGTLSALLAGQVGREWTEPLGRSYVASHALRGIDVGADISQFVDWVEECWIAYRPILPHVAPASAPAAPEPAVPAAEAAEAAGAEALPEAQEKAPDLPAEPATEAPADPAASPEDPVVLESLEPAPGPEPLPVVPSVPRASDHLAALIREDASTNVSEQSGVELTWRLLDEPVIGPQQSVRMTMTFRNVVQQDKEIVPELQAPEGWKSATRLTAFRLPAGASQVFPLVLQSPAKPVLERVYARLKWGTAEYRTPILPAQLWHMVGPFVNHDGGGFTKEYPAESQIKLGQTFLGRSEIPVKWEARWMTGVVFDLEHDFKGGPGAILLWAKVRFPFVGRCRIFAATGVGIVVRADGKKVLSYHDHHQPDLRKSDRYSGFFDTSGETTLLVKVLRDRKPLEPLTLCFFGPDGAVVHPIAFLPME